VNSETRARRPVLRKRDQKTPWLRGSKPVSPRKAVGRKIPSPNGPSARNEAGNTPSLPSAGMIRV
jgi:hypothetical protein